MSVSRGKVKSIQAIFDKRHPLLSRLFRRYSNSSAVNFMFNFIVGISVVFLLSLALYGTVAYFIALADSFSILKQCSVFLVTGTLFVTVRQQCDFLDEKSKDNEVLQVLPIKKSEIILALQCHLYKNTLPLILFFLLAFIISTVSVRTALCSVLLGTILCFLAPILGLLGSFAIGVFISKSMRNLQDKHLVHPVIFKEKNLIWTLVSFEFRNLLKFPSLITELIMQVVFCVSILYCSVMINPKLIVCVILFNALSMINVSSFSREGKFHDMLDTIPIKASVRVSSKSLFYFLLSLPCLLISFIIVFVIYPNSEIFFLIPCCLNIWAVSECGLFHSRKNETVNWSTIQEVFKIDYQCLFVSIGLSLVTVYFLIANNNLIGMLSSIIINVVFGCAYYFRLIRSIK